MKTTFTWSIFAILFTLSISANASPICEVFRTLGQPQKLANCETIISRGLVPNQDALRYTVKYLVDNQSGLKDPSCAISSIDINDICVPCRKSDWIKNGFENSCSFIINDLERPWKSQPASHRTTAYYVDLCAEDPTKIVSSFYMNGGIGPRFDDTADRDNSELGWNKSTLAGAFKLEGKVRDDFTPTRPAAYQALRDRNGGKLQVLYMVGLNSSNNTTESDKPIHVSPFKTSFGCPSVSETTAKRLHEMVASGSTLYMAYAGPKFEQRGNSCMNDPSNSVYNSGSKKPSNGAAQ